MPGLAAVNKHNMMVACKEDFTVPVPLFMAGQSHVAGLICNMLLIAISEFMLACTCSSTALVPNEAGYLVYFWNLHNYC